MGTAGKSGQSPLCRLAILMVMNGHPRTQLCESMSNCATYSAGSAGDEHVFL
jgi:hypothetical protein